MPPAGSCPGSVTTASSVDGVGAADFDEPAVGRAGSSSRWEDPEQGDAGTGESASSRGGCISAVAPGRTGAGMAALRGVPRRLLPAAGARALQHERPAELPVSTRRHQATRADTEPFSTPCASRRGSARSAGHWLAEQHAQGREDNLYQPFYNSLHTCHQHHFTSTRPLCATRT